LGNFGEYSNLYSAQNDCTAIHEPKANNQIFSRRTKGQGVNFFLLVQKLKGQHTAALKLKTNQMFYKI